MNRRRHGGGGSEHAALLRAATPLGWRNHTTQQVLNDVQARIDATRARHGNVDDEVSGAMRAELRLRGWVVADVRVDLQQAHPTANSSGDTPPGTPLQGTITVLASGPSGEPNRDPATAEIHWNASRQPGANVPETRHMLLPLHDGHVGFQVNVTTPGREGAFEFPAVDLTNHLHHETAAQRDSRLGEDGVHRDGYRLVVTLLRDQDEPGTRTTWALHGEAGIHIPTITGGTGTFATTTDQVTETRGRSTSGTWQVQGQANVPVRGLPVELTENRTVTAERHRETARTTGGDLTSDMTIKIHGVDVRVRVPQVTADTPNRPSPHARSFDHLAPAGHREMGTQNRNKTLGADVPTTEVPSGQQPKEDPQLKPTESTAAGTAIDPSGTGSPVPDSLPRYAENTTMPSVVQRQPDLHANADNDATTGTGAADGHPTATNNPESNTAQVEATAVQRAPNVADTEQNTGSNAAATVQGHTPAETTNGRQVNEAAHTTSEQVERDPSHKEHDTRSTSNDGNRTDNHDDDYQ